MASRGRLHRQQKDGTHLISHQNKHFADDFMVTMKSFDWSHVPGAHVIDKWPTGELHPLIQYANIKTATRVMSRWLRPLILYSLRLLCRLIGLLGCLF